MRDNLALPDLTFPGYPQGQNETRLSLERLLYRGGASLRVREAYSAISDGRLGKPLPSRIDLVVPAHEMINGKLAAGGSPTTTRTQAKILTTFFFWAEKAGLDLTMKSVQMHYIHWTDMLYHRATVSKSLSSQTAYSMGRRVGQILDYVIGRETPMLELSRLREPKGRKTPRGRVADKQNLENTFAFGRLMQDICDGLTLKAISGPRPVRIPLSAGGELVKSLGRHIGSRTPIVRTAARERQRLAKQAKRHAEYHSRPTLQSGRIFVNLRMLAELLVFIAQTGMNLAQVHRLELRQFSYASDIDGYKVRDYKARRGGEVLFEIFKEYRSHFERYLEWRRQLFPSDSRLFPFIRSKGAHESSRPCFEQIRSACKDVGIEWISPRVLRSTRINWLLRRSGDADLTAAMAQHTNQMLLRVYEIPSQQRAIGEVTRFWLTADPSMCNSSPLASVAPGACNATASPVLFKPESATAPDCIHPSGCLWCAHHRDVDSLDYIWALNSFRHLKALELSQYRSPEGNEHFEHPAYLALSRLSEKLKWFRNSNDVRRTWVEEANARIDEGSFHPDWARLIQATEGTQL